MLGSRFSARVILFDQPAGPNTEWFIFAYASDGNYAGDSWYTSLENAEQAARNANSSLDVDALYVTHAIVNEGPKLKRFTPAAMGRATPVHKRTSHIDIIVSEKEGR